MRITVVLILCMASAFAQPRARMGEYALILQDPPVAQVASGRQDLTSSLALAHRSKLETAHRGVLAELARRKLTVHRSSQLLINAIYIDAANVAESSLTSI